jgi:hypothetical protein
MCELGGSLACAAGAAGVTAGDWPAGTWPADAGTAGPAIMLTTVIQTAGRHIC